MDSLSHVESHGDMSPSIVTGIGKGEMSIAFDTLGRERADPRSIADQKLREEKYAFAAMSFSPLHQEARTRLQYVAQGLTERFFPGLPVVVVEIEAPKSNKHEWAYAEFTGDGSKCAVKVRPEVITGSWKSVRAGDEYVDGRWLLAEDYVFAGLLQVWVQVVLGKSAKQGIHNYGKEARDKANEINAVLGLPAVREEHARGKDKDLPSVTHWPMCSRSQEPDYYLGAYVRPGERKNAEPTDTEVLAVDEAKEALKRALEEMKRTASEWHAIVEMLERTEDDLTDGVRVIPRSAIEDMERDLRDVHLTASRVFSEANLAAQAPKTISNIDDTPKDTPLAQPVTTDGDTKKPAPKRLRKSRTERVYESDLTVSVAGKSLEDMRRVVRQYQRDFPASNCPDGRIEFLRRGDAGLERVTITDIPAGIRSVALLDIGGGQEPVTVDSDISPKPEMPIRRKWKTKNLDVADSTAIMDAVASARFENRPIPTQDLMIKYGGRSPYRRTIVSEWIAFVEAAPDDAQAAIDAMRTKNLKSLERQGVKFA